MLVACAAAIIGAVIVLDWWTTRSLRKEREQEVALRRGGTGTDDPRVTRARSIGKHGIRPVEYPPEPEGDFLDEALEDWMFER